MRGKTLEFRPSYEGGGPGPDSANEGRGPEPAADRRKLGVIAMGRFGGKFAGRIVRLSGNAGLCCCEGLSDESIKPG